MRLRYWWSCGPRTGAAVQELAAAAAFAEGAGGRGDGLEEAAAVALFDTPSAPALMAGLGKESGVAIGGLMLVACHTAGAAVFETVVLTVGIRVDVVVFDALDLQVF